MRGRGLRENMRLLAVVGTAAAAIGYGTTASADTLEWALVLAYQNNPSLNAQRAALRAVDENVPQALSGYRPKLSATAAGGFNYFNQVNKTINQQSFPNQPIYSSIAEDLPTRQFGATATQTLFNGFQTANRTRQAESQVMGARETLRVTEQQVLLDAATAYMNLLRDQAILDLNPATSKCSPSNSNKPATASMSAR
jgi:outer membrane protein